MRRKLRSSRGETLVEVLCATLVAMLAIALLFGGITASASIDLGARRSDAAHYAALTQAENQATPAGEAQLKVQNIPLGKEQTVTVRLYGGEGMYSYAPKAEAGP